MAQTHVRRSAAGDPVNPGVDIGAERLAGSGRCTRTRPSRKLYELNKACSRDIPNRGEFYTLEDYVAQRIDVPSFMPSGVIIAFDGDEWIGMCALSDHLDQGYMFVERTGVRAEYRQRGISLAMKVLALRLTECALMSGHGSPLHNPPHTPSGCSGRAPCIRPPETSQAQLQSVMSTEKRRGWRIRSRRDDTARDTVLDSRTSRCGKDHACPEKSHIALRFSPDEWMIPLFAESDADGKRDLLEGLLING